MLEIEKIAEDIGISVEAYKKLCRIFLDTSKKDLIALKEAIESEDRPAIRVNAHHLKGAAMNIDLIELSELVKKLETSAETQSFSELTKQRNTIEQEYKKAELSLRKHL